MDLEGLISRKLRPEPDLVIRQTTSRESTHTLGVLHEARCKHCGSVFGPDTLDSIMKLAGRHLRDHHGIVLNQWIDVPLGQERWEGTKHG